jgi:MtN3 and saliva related transmembrane protein
MKPRLAAHEWSAWSSRACRRSSGPLAEGRGLAPPCTRFDTSTLIIGVLAAISSTGSFAPQAWKIIKTRETKDISTGMYSLTVAGFALWLAYGVMLGQWPLIATNGICLALAAFILVMKILPASGKHAVADTLDPSVDGS